jgi:tetratricopeptide (TPR) repeat protein
MRKIFETIIFVLILAFYGTVLFHKINLPTDDLGRHLENGKIVWQNKEVLTTNFYSYTEPNFPFTNHHWLSGVTFYLLYLLIGFSGLVIFKIALLLAAFSLVFKVASKKGNFWLAALASIPAIFLLAERTDVRPEIFSLFFTAAFLYVLSDFNDNPKSKKIYWLIPLQILWVNLHIYFLIGILITGGFILEKIIYGSFNKPKENSEPLRRRGIFFLFSKNFKNNPLIKRGLHLLGSLILVSLINPFTYKIFLYPLQMFKNYGYDIVENKSPFFLEHLMHDPAILTFKISIAVLAISFIASLAFRRFRIFYLLASLATIITSWMAIRDLPFLGLILLPAASISLAPLWSSWQKQLKKKTSIYIKIILASSLSIIFIFLSYSVLAGKIFENKERGIGLTFESNNSADFFKKENLTGPIFNNYDIGSYLVFHLYPKEKVFVDNRPEAYSAQFFTQDYIPMQTTEEKWQEQLRRYNFNVIYFTQEEGTWWGQTFLSQRLNDPEWALVYADSQAVIFLRNKPENETIIKKYLITKDNLQEKISPLINSQDNRIKMSAANILSLIGRDDLTFDICAQIAKTNPDYSQAWLTMGQIKSAGKNSRDIREAIRYLQKAADIGENFPSVYNQIGLDYFNLGQYTQAKENWKESLQINSSDQNAKDYLGQYEKLGLP